MFKSIFGVSGSLSVKRKFSSGLGSGVVDEVVGMVSFGSGLGLDGGSDLGVGGGSGLGVDGGSGLGVDDGSGFALEVSGNVPLVSSSSLKIIIVFFLYLIFRESS